MPVPGDPTLDSLSGSNAQIAATFTAANPADVIYARYRIQGGAWSAESETFKRTGSGVIPITGRTNGVTNEITGYAKDGTETSDWTTPLQGVPYSGAYEIDQAFYDKLGGISALTALISTRLYQDFADESDATPYVVLQMITEPGERHILAASALSKASFQVDVYASDADSRKAVAEAIREGLDGLRGILWGDLDIRSVALVGQQSSFEPLRDGSQRGYNRQRMDVDITYFRSVPTFGD